ncbi:uncharacterized protein LOC130966159 [Arachis stenosperma]|uniref:uncharacterized protein LOC130966159 n=1 Tax=Arachis stenosperma TaxID=217475 RepID=UPI0025ACE187|nr:uncharacterized protein LOC130966159 [Arachis stenosperma]
MTAKNQEASIKNMERQIGQLSKHFATERPSSSLPSDTIPNPKEECKAIQLRSGRTLMSNNETTRKQVESSKKPTDTEEANDQNMVPNKSTENPKRKEDQPINIHEGEEEAQKKEKAFIPPLPYLQRFNKETKDQHFRKFLETFKKLAINIPLAEGIPPKHKDPGSFVVACTIGKMTLDKALCDLGASINLMPLSMMRKLAIEELKPTRMSLVMANRSTKTPNGIVENLLVKVGEIIFPADFVILDNEEEGNNSIILGRPFLATARAIIDVEKGEMIFRVHNEKMVINVFKSMQHPPEQEDYLRVDMIENLVEEMLEANHHEQEEEGGQETTKEQAAEISTNQKAKPDKKEEVQK